MELRNNAKENIWMETMRNMVERDIVYKENIYKKIAGIKTRQIVSLIIASCIFLVLVALLTIAVGNMKDITALIHVLTEGFGTLNKQP